MSETIYNQFEGKLAICSIEHYSILNQIRKFNNIHEEDKNTFFIQACFDDNQ